MGTTDLGLSDPKHNPPSDRTSRPPPASSLMDLHRVEIVVGLGQLRGEVVASLAHLLQQYDWTLRTSIDDLHSFPLMKVSLSGPHNPYVIDQIFVAAGKMGTVLTTLTLEVAPCDVREVHPDPRGV